MSRGLRGRRPARLPPSAPSRAPSRAFRSWRGRGGPPGCGAERAALSARVGCSPRPGPRAPREGPSPRAAAGAACVGSAGSLTPRLCLSLSLPSAAAAAGGLAELDPHRSPVKMKAADEPAYLTVGTDVSAKYRGAFCEAKIKTVKRLVKVKVLLKQDNTTQLVQDDQVKGPLRVGAIVETRTSDGSIQEAIISKLTDASWYTVVFDDGDERTLRRTSLCLKGERHFAESETLDQLPLTNPEHFGTPVIAKKTNRGRRSSLPVTEDEKEEDSSEEEDEDKRRLNDELLGKVVSVISTAERTDWYPALVVSPSCNDDVTVKKDQCLVRSFIILNFTL